MATNPPIIIGSFDNVPAPGSGVKSDWAQEISQYVTDHVGELFYSQITANVSIPAGTTEPAAVQVINPGNVTYEAKPIMLEFFASTVQQLGPASSQVLLNLWDGATDLGRWAQWIAPTATANAGPVYLRRRITPTAGAHNYNVRGWAASSGVGAVNAAAPNLPAFLRAHRI